MAQAVVKSPIDINTTDKKCYETCMFRFDYGTGSCMVTNMTTYISLTYDSVNSTVTYNDVEYTVEDVRIYSPSLNKYYGDTVDAEVIITHTGMSEKKLLVCIPVKSTDSKNKSTEFFSQIIPNVPPKGERSPSTVNVSNFSLNNIVPQGSYYAYTGSLPYPEFDGANDIIVFDPQIASSSLSVSNYKMLLKLIQGAGDVAVNSTYDIDNLYYNKVGSIDVTGEDDIYIDCQYVEDTGEDKPSGLEQVSVDPETEKIINYALIGVGTVFGAAILWGVFKKVRAYLA